MRVLREVSRCDGFNIGMNQGAVAGAGVDEHLHQHIVPRWSADANFFPIIAGPRRCRSCSARSAGRVAEARPTARTCSAHLADRELQQAAGVELLRLDELQFALARLVRELQQVVHARHGPRQRIRGVPART
jgi:hypothetical protein